MTHAEMMEVETRAGVWLGRVLGLVALMAGAYLIWRMM